MNLTTLPSCLRASATQMSAGIRRKPLAALRGITLPISLALAAAVCGAPTKAQAQATQTVSFGPIGDQNALTTLSLTATASSSLPVSFSSSTPAVCTVNGNTASLVGAGGCLIEAIQAGNAQYAMATMWQGFNVHYLAQTVAFTPVGDQYAVATVGLTASASTGLPITFSSLTPTVCTVAGSTATMVAAGGCELMARQAGNSVYLRSTVTQGLTVHHANQAIAFAPVATQYVGNPLTLSASASSGLPVSYASATTRVCAVSGNTASMIAPGACTLVANQTGNAAYFPAHQTTQTFTVSPLIGDILGDSIDYCEGATSTVTCGTYNILEGLGVQLANINRYAYPGAAMEEIANQQLNDTIVTPGTITIADGCQNCNQMNLYPAEYLTEQQAMVAMLVDASVTDPSLAGSSLAQKQFATAAVLLNGTTTASTDYPAKGQTCTSGACEFLWNNVPGSNIFIFVEVTTASSYNPIVTVDGTMYNGNWSTGSALIGYLEPFNKVSHGPWPIQVALPPGANGGSGLHTVTVAVPGGQTVIQVVGAGNSAPAGGPWVIADSQFVWYDNTTTDRVASNNSAWANAIQEVQQSGLSPIYVDLEPSINGYTAFGATITGAPTRPDLAFTITNGSLSAISIVPVSIGGGGGGVCTANPTITFFGGGAGAIMPTATLSCSGGTVTGANITSAGSGITLPQQFDTQSLHPNDAGHLAIALGTLTQVGNLIP